jgi:hypothetical protein
MEGGFFAAKLKETNEFLSFVPRRGGRNTEGESEGGKRKKLLPTT